MRLRAAGCWCAASGGGAASIAASCSPTTPTGRACCGRSRRPAPPASSSPTATSRRWCGISPSGATRRAPSSPNTAIVTTTMRPPLKLLSPMRRFAQLFAELDATTATGAKVDALRRYFLEADAGRCRVGDVLPRRRQAAAGGAVVAARERRVRACADRARGSSRRPTPPSGISRRHWRSCCRRRRG